jgi:hypothetical protein
VIPRACPVQRTTPDQLTLDDWAEMRIADREVSKTQSGEASRHDPLPGTPVTPATKATEQANQPPPAARVLLETPGALLTRSHLRDLGLERRAIDAVFRRLPVVALPGYSRPLIHADEYLDLIAQHTYRDDRVRASHA